METKVSCADAEASKAVVICVAAHKNAYLME